MSEHRPYPPSSRKLARLREEGEVPYSRDFLSFAVVLAASLSVLALWSLRHERFRQLAMDIFSKPDALPQEFFALAAQLLISFALLFAVQLLLLNGLQTRFLLSSKAAAPRENRRGSAVAFFAKATFLLLVVGFFARAAYAAYQSALFEALLSGELKFADLLARANAEAGGSLAVFGVIFLGSLFVAGLFSLLAEMFAFRKRHSMTRAEAEADAREGENPQRKLFSRRGARS